ncbi:carbamoyltransferase family protein [Roseateles violae]|uniref:Carbamoyltransferase C-terminal domain-containing protein n=1 Tax=Roseateles violae TaxID=3058042 RepID=A0ABT8DXP1_9BURK|nr:carbamoyltransferase C-terminal domain-containing protein [Pelomonas sp. PFR6]MDN3922348.1 carbamoyltransferase C-terminal domain-containing protein [Pelomonas sp. PFR6]
MKVTLGLNAAFHDSAAVLLVDGEPVAAAEEERFTRIKHAKRPLPFSTWELPFHAIDWCLKEAGLTMAEVDHVGYSFDPQRFLAGREDLLLPGGSHIALPLQPSAARDPRAQRWDSPWDPLFLASIVNAPRQLADGAPHHLRRRLLVGERRRWQWHFVGHHLSHQASAFLAAPFERCAVLTLDGRGERATTAYGVYREQRYLPLGEVEMPHSLGLLYEQVTRQLGFLHSSDEYKVMALAALGEPRWAESLAEQLRLTGAGRYEIAELDLDALVGPSRPPGVELEQRHFDLAASLQQLLETRVLELAGWLREVSGEPLLAMAGGVALNCVMNARLRDEGPFEQVWVQPAAGDAGTALGAALWVDARERLPAPERLDSNGGGQRLAPRRWTMRHAYLGPQWPDEEVEALLRWARLGYERLADDVALAERTAALLADNAIVGWFQGRMEWGPRALGARSILASPIDPAMQQRLNELKDREDFRPVAPAVGAEDFADWFEPAGANGGSSPYMLFTYRCKAERRARIPSACHSDGSARVQTVHADSNPSLHALLQAFGRRTGVPVLVNTSFNVRGEPIVCSPKDALDAFFSTPLDALVIGRFLLRKSP